MQASASVNETKSTILHSGLNLDKQASVSGNSFSLRSILLICIIFGLIPFLIAARGCGSGDNSHKIDSRTTVTGAAVVNPLLVNSTITATDASGTSFSLGKTDTNGEFSFRTPQDCVYPLLLSFSEGYLHNSTIQFQGQLKTVVRNSNFTRAWLQPSPRCSLSSTIPCLKQIILSVLTRQSPSCKAYSKILELLTI